MSPLSLQPPYPQELTSHPEHWEFAELDRLIADVHTGFSSGQHTPDPQGGIPHLRPMNITRAGTLTLEGLLYVPDVNPLRAKHGDVLFNNTNSRELVGKTAAMDIDEPLAFSNHLTCLTPKPGVSHRFLAYQLHYLWRAGYFSSLSKQHVNQASIALSTLLTTVPIAIGPTDEQLRIVAALESRLAVVSETTASLSRIRELLERLRSGIIAKSVSNVFPELERGPRKEHSKGDNNSGWNLGPLPSGWTWRRVDQVGEVRLGRQRSPKASPGAPLRPYLRVANVYEDRIEMDDLLRMPFTASEVERYQLISGDILLNEGQSPELVGRPAVYRGVGVPDLCFQNTLLRFRALSGVSSGFALLVFRHYFRTGRFTETARWTTNLAHLGAERFAAMPFPLPSLAVQEQIVLEADQTLRTIAELEDRLSGIEERLESVRGEVLVRAFSGDLVAAGSEVVPAKALIGARWERRITRRRQQEKPADSKEIQMQNRPILEVLDAAGGELTPEQLFEATGLSEDNVLQFFEGLRGAVKTGQVRQVRHNGSTLIVVAR
jgi:type I restriction enzyme S subunit